MLRNDAPWLLLGQHGCSVQSSFSCTVDWRGTVEEGCKKGEQVMDCHWNGIWGHLDPKKDFLAKCSRTYGLLVHGSTTLKQGATQTRVGNLSLCYQRDNV